MEIQDNKKSHVGPFINGSSSLPLSCWTHASGIVFHKVYLGPQAPSFEETNLTVLIKASPGAFWPIVCSVIVLSLLLVLIVHLHNRSHLTLYRH
jgi:hypothetical protein